MPVRPWRRVGLPDSITRIVRFREILDLGGASKNPCNLDRKIIHHRPKIVVLIAARITGVLCVGFEPDNGAGHTVAVDSVGFTPMPLPDPVLWVCGSFVPNHLADPAQRNDNPLVVEVLKLVKLIDVGDLSE